MTVPGEEWWDRARHARDRLVTQVISHPNISMIDIGEDPRGASGTPVLRVHLRQAGGALPNIPSSVDGIPVRVIQGDYRPESESPPP